MKKTKEQWIKEFYQFLVNNGILFEFMQEMEDGSFNELWSCIKKEYQYERKSGWKEDKSLNDYCAFNLVNMGINWNKANGGYDHWQDIHFLWWEHSGIGTNYARLQRWLRSGRRLPNKKQEFKITPFQFNMAQKRVSSDFKLAFLAAKSQVVHFHTLLNDCELTGLHE